MDVLRNRDVFLRDPLATTIPNDGVAKVVEPVSDGEWEVLRHELETFVCDGAFRSGLEVILSTFIENLQMPQQPAAWVSGFYGSGKSHLVRVLEYLWRNMAFPDGTRARALTNLPTGIREQLAELSRLADQGGGLWSAAGNLGSGTGSVRLALLAVLFRSAKLPEQYPEAKLCLWLKQNGWYEAVEQGVTSMGKTLAGELRHMYVSPVLAESLYAMVPDLADRPSDVGRLLTEQFPTVLDVTDGELQDTMEEILLLQGKGEGKLPLTLLVLDELQQFIGNDPERTLHIQNTVEACSSRFDSHVLFVGTGQSALEAHTELSKLQGRFSVNVMLSDVDVEKVVREVILRKSPDKIGRVQEVLDKASGEIDRHLAGTRIASRAEDVQDWVADYPVLPVRRRLWGGILRWADTAGTQGQLRTQLRIMHEAARGVGDEPLGTVAPADEIYRQIKGHMQQTQVLPQDVATMISQLDNGTEDGTLRSRLCSLIFMINKLPSEGPMATGVQATAEALGDLLVDDLAAGSAGLRERIPTVLESLVQDARLFMVGTEYRLQTRESAEWESDYRGRVSQVLANNVRMAGERDRCLRQAVERALGGLRFSQGKSQTVRQHELHFGPEKPASSTDRIPVWIQTEWATSGGAVREEAQQAGTESPVVFVFLPRLDADRFRATIAEACAAEETVQTRAMPQTEGGRDARDAMGARAERAWRELSGLADNVVRNTRIYQGGGHEVSQESFAPAITAGVNAGMVRLFPGFSDADHVDWHKVVSTASDGVPDPLSMLGFDGDAERHPVCREVRSFVGGSGKKGSAVRDQFSSPPYGWPRDAVHGALLALLAGGFLRASQNGEAVIAKGMTHSRIGSTDFFSEGITVSASDRIALRKLLFRMGLPAVSGEEAKFVPEALQMLSEQALAASGEPPLPEPRNKDVVDDLQGLTGNQQIVEVAKKVDVLLEHSEDWRIAGGAKQDRVPQWDLLISLLGHADSVPDAGEVRHQVDAIRVGRMLLDDPDPSGLLLIRVTAGLREAVHAAWNRMAVERDRRVAHLETWDRWQQLSTEQRSDVLGQNGLTQVAEPDIGTPDALLACFDETSFEDWHNRWLAVRTRVAQASGTSSSNADAEGDNCSSAPSDFGD